MPETAALPLADLPIGSKKTLPVGDGKVLLVRIADVDGEPSIFAVEAECPHAKAPLEKGAVCNGRIVCPFHCGTFELRTGALLEPPPLRGLRRYPVRVLGSQIVVEAEPVAPTKPEPIAQGSQLVFVGGGAATASALAYLRDQGFAGSITVIDAVGDEPVDRTTLTKQALSGDKPLDKLPLFGEGEPLPITRIHSRVKQLNIEAKSITLEDDRSISYDAVMLATGGTPKPAGIQGEAQPHVFTIRHTDDLRRMEPLLVQDNHAVLIGDSFIAFEAASALQQRGLHCTIVARSQAPFAKKFGEDVAKSLLALHRSKGVTILTGVKAANITAEAVELRSGAVLPADLVIVAVGVEPVTGYAGSLAKGKRGGIEVGPDLRVTDGVFVAGDIASVDGLRIEHWRLAEQHGRVAAAAMLASLIGEEKPIFNAVPFFWTAHFGKRFNYLGHADMWDDLHTEGSPAELNFLSFYMQKGHVAAVISCGRDTAIAALAEPMRGSMTLTEALRIAATARNQ